MRGMMGMNDARPILIKLEITNDEGECCARLPILVRANPLDDNYTENVVHLRLNLSAQCDASDNKAGEG